ncbi:MAG: TrkH family potassium uptake protein [Thermodesulfovibrionales bacterium]
MNLLLIFNIIGTVLIIISFFMALPVAVSVMDGGRDLLSLAASAGATLVAGGALSAITRGSRRDEIKHRDVFGVVTFAWLAASLFGALPFALSGSVELFTDAYFEAMAGFTTTGATVIADVESLSMGVLFWRSLTQWLGGMGIILFAIAILPFIGTGGMQLFKAEAPELTVDRLRPRIIDTAKALWYIYAALTAAAFGLYMWGGMGAFDAVCHAFTTLATGGFSTKNTSLAYYQSPFIDAVATVFMFLAGVNYAIYFYTLKGDIFRFWRSSEFRFYLTITAGAIALITAANYGSVYPTLAGSLRYSAFQVVSVMTTTGYATADYEFWVPFSVILLAFLMFFGGMIGSTGGGMKQVRVLLMLKQSYRELYQLIHPHAVTTVKLDGRPIQKELLGSIWGFLFLFLFILVVSTLGMTALGLDMVTASSTVLSAMSNVGPALGEAGPAENYSGIPAAGKWILVFCMLAGRLEIYTVIILFVPRFWKK